MMNQRKTTLLFTLITLILCQCQIRSGTIHAKEHPIPVITADIFVTQKRITMRVQVYADQIPWIEEIDPDEKGIFDPDDFQDAMIDHGQYIIERVQLIDGDGNPFKGKLHDTVFYKINSDFSTPEGDTSEIIEIEFPDEGVEESRLMGFKVGYEIDYPLEKAPTIISIRNDIVEEFVLPSELQVWLKQEGTDATFRMNIRAERPDTIRLDWENPPLSREDSEEEWKKWFELQEKKTLGISEFSSVMSFIYITRREVRHEIVVPLATLADLIDFETADPLFITVEEQKAAMKKVKAYFSVGNPVTIDGIEVQPIIDRIDFSGPNLRDLAMRVPPAKRSMINGRVGVILVYGTKTYPNKVTVTWDKFSSRIINVDSAVIAFDKVFKTRFSKFLDSTSGLNTFEWESSEGLELASVDEINSNLSPPKLYIPLWATVAACLGAVCLIIALVRSIRTHNKELSDQSFMINALLIVGSMVCGGVSLMTLSYQKIPVDHPFATAEISESESTTIFSAIHANIFRAFDYHSESDVYDALSKSVEGELLTELYLQIQKSLKMQEQGGAISHIEDVDIVEGSLANKLRKSDGHYEFDYDCSWNIVGTVEHWGHVHRRTNQYKAQFTVKQTGDHWKIVSMQLTDPVQGKIEQSLRRYTKDEDDSESDTGEDSEPKENDS